MRKTVLSGLLVLTLLLGLAGCGGNETATGWTEENDVPRELTVLPGEAPALTLESRSWELGTMNDLCSDGTGYRLATDEGIFTLDRELVLSEEDPVRESAALLCAENGKSVFAAIRMDGPGFVIRDEDSERFVLEESHILNGSQLLARDGAVYVCDGFQLIRDGVALGLPQEPGFAWQAAALTLREGELFAILTKTEDGTHKPASAVLVPLDPASDRLEPAKGLLLPVQLWEAEPLCAPESGCIYAAGRLWRLEDGGIRLLAELQNCGVNPGALRRVLPEEDRILCLESRELQVLKPQLPEGADASSAPKERGLLRVGVVGYESGDLQKLISYVNRYGDCPRLETKLYADTEQLNRAVLTGEVQLLSAGDLSLLQNYARKGLLLPVDELLPELFSSGLLYENMIEALRLDGHCYYLPPCFLGYVNLLPKRYETDPASLNSMSALEALLTEKEPEAFGLLTKESALGAYWLPNTLDHWIDQETGTARFDTEEFVEFLKFCDKYAQTEEEAAANSAGFSEELTPPPYFRMLMPMSVIPSNQYRDYDYYRLPCEGLSTIALMNDCYLAAVQGADPAEAASFFTTVLTDQGWHEKGRIGDDSGWINYDILFLNRQWTEADLEAIEQDRLEALTGMSTFDPEAYQTAMEKLRGYLNEANHFEGNVSELIDVIQEEAQPYFHGDVTAEEAARRIQNRVEIYLAERG